MTHLKYSLEKLGKTFELPKKLLKTEMNHDENDENIGEIKKTKGYRMLKLIFSVLLIVMRDIVNLWRK